MPANNRRETAALAFNDAGREVTQAFDVLGSNLTLTAGTLAALLAVIGAGELFHSSTVILASSGKASAVPGQVATAHGIPKLSSTSLLLLAFGLPLVGRFFVRATLGYQQLERFNLVKNAQWRYLSGDASWQHAKAHYDVYVVDWRSPGSLWTLSKGSAKYGFVWLFVLYALVLGWAFYTASGGWLPRAVAAMAVVIGIGYDVVTLRRSSYFQMPTPAEHAELAVGVADAEQEPQDAAGPVEELETGVFIGTRRTRLPPGNA
jgi:hypothetical protein